MCVACGDKIPQETFLATTILHPLPRPPYCLIQSDGGGATGEEGEKFPCGECGEEVKDDDEAIYCESGCEQWYHRCCSTLHVDTLVVTFTLFNCWPFSVVNLALLVFTCTCT